MVQVGHEAALNIRVANHQNDWEGIGRIHKGHAAEYNRVKLNRNAGGIQGYAILGARYLQVINIYEIER